ncbi:MAG: 30S ribosome-binding factor RbfA [Actinomycetota bacterium]|nr:30S ribosome-binding factor RbfA [Actinomycetota bacterium]
MTSAFLRRVNKTLRAVIADEVAHLKDPGLGFITITAVDTAPDLRNARVYYSVLGDGEQAQATAHALERAKPHVRSQVGRRVRLKYLPDLRFEADRAIEHGMRIEQLLAQIHEQEETG